MATSRRARAVAQARQAADDAAFLRRAKAFVGLLRNQAGIPVRQPAHQVAPFRAIPLNWFAVVGVENTNATGSDTIATRSIPVNWSSALVTPSSGSVSNQDTAFLASNGIDAYTGPTSTTYSDDTAEPFPDGYLGFITSASCNALIDSADADDIPPVRNCRWSWKIDGAYVSGFRNALPQQELQAVAAGFLVANALYPPGGTINSALGCPVQIRPGQRSMVEGALYAPTGNTFKRLLVYRISGYAIPTKNGADRTIFDTLTD